MTSLFSVCRLQDAGREMHFVLGGWPAIAAPDMLCHTSSNVNPFSMLFDFGVYNLNVIAGKSISYIQCSVLYHFLLYLEVPWAHG